MKRKREDSEEDDIREDPIVTLKQLSQKVYCFLHSTIRLSLTSTLLVLYHYGTFGIIQGNQTH